MIVHHKRRYGKYVHGRGVIYNSHKRYVHGKGFIDQLLPLAWNFATNPESAKNVGKIAMDVVDIGRKVKDVIDDVKSIKLNAKKAATELNKKGHQQSEAKEGVGFVKI